MTAQTFLPSEEICWQAVSQRDSTYTGVFVIAVKTTKIYCRPGCPARMPKRENITFFALPAAAEQAGFRACKRCHPRDVAPRDEQVCRVQDICTYIQTHIENTLTLEELSEVFHWNASHLQKTFKQVMGITPRQYTDACRMQRFKTELRDGSSVTEAIYQAGYGGSSRLYERADANLGMMPSVYQKGGMAMTIAYTILECSMGQLLIGATERGICSLTMGDTADEVLQNLHREFPNAHIQRDDAALTQGGQQVLAYLNGWQPHFDLPLDMRVTAFQKRVLDELQRIPYGATRTYGEIAAAIGEPKAARAVGRACATNPIPLIIPCHRVVGGDGSITGYAFGVERKKQLLDLEQRPPTLENNNPVELLVTPS